jgi:voltage-gated potassium channel
VVSAYQMGGARLAAAILRPSVVDFLELASPRRGEAIDLEEIEVAAGSAVVGSSIGAIEEKSAQLRVVALKRGEDRIRILPERGLVVEPGDHLVVIGARGDLTGLARRAAGETDSPALRSTGPTASS